MKAKAVERVILGQVCSKVDLVSLPVPGFPDLPLVALDRQILVLLFLDETFIASDLKFYPLVNLPETREHVCSQV